MSTREKFEFKLAQCITKEDFIYFICSSVDGLETIELALDRNITNFNSLKEIIKENTFEFISGYRDNKNLDKAYIKFCVNDFIINLEFDLLYCPFPGKSKKKEKEKEITICTYLVINNNNFSNINILNVRPIPIVLTSTSYLSTL